MYVRTNVYNINGGVANIFYRSCAQIDNNQQVYETHMQVALKFKGKVTVLVFRLMYSQSQH
jgi:hypothetical protein